MRALRFIPGKSNLQGAAILAALCLPLLILAPGWEGFGYSPRSFFSDISISHYPNSLFLVRSLQQGQFPLWSPLILSGYPFAANPLSGAWYLPGWIAFLFPLPLGFNVNVFLHLWWSGIGMWLFLRASGRSSLSALLGAFAWELLPKIFAHFGAGHLTLIYAIAWTPWLFWVEFRRQREHNGGVSNLVPGVILGVMALADLRWAVNAGLIWAAFSFYQAFQHKRLFENRPAHQWKGWMGVVWNGLRPVGLSALLAGMISAPQLIPLLEYTGLSTRASLSLADNLNFSLQPIHLFGLITPAFQGMAEWVIYPGGAALLAIGWVLTRPGLRRGSLFWVGILLFCLVFSLGSSIPMLSFLYQLPGFNLLRVPARMMIGFGFASAVLLSQVVDSLGVQGDQKQRHFWGNLFLFGLCVFPWVILAGLWFLSGEINLSYLWGGVFLLGSALVLVGRVRGWISQEAFQIAWMVVVLLDLGTVSQSQFIYRAPAEINTVQEDVARWLAGKTGFFRVYSPSYSLPQQTSAIWGLNQAGGVDPLQLKAYVMAFEPGTGVPSGQYSVTLPPYANGNPWESNQDALPSASRLGLFNVRYVVAEYPLETDGLIPVGKIGSSYLYENELSLPRAWVQAANTEVGTGVEPVSIQAFTSNRIELTAEGPGLLVLSEIDYPGWHVAVDGSEQAMQRPLGVLRGVLLTAGEHRIVFSFQPVSISLGLGLAVLGWFWLIVQGLASLRNRV